MYKQGYTNKVVKLRYKSMLTLQPSTKCFQRMHKASSFIWNPCWVPLAPFWENPTNVFNKKPKEN